MKKALSNNADVLKNLKKVKEEIYKGTHLKLCKLTSDFIF
jgi:hypothetical protein